jgi:hypothetical protein
VCCVAVGVLGKSYCCARFSYSFEILYLQPLLSGRELISETPSDTAKAGRSTQLDARKGTKVNVRERFSEKNAMFDGSQTSLFVCSHWFLCFIRSSENVYSK